MGGTAMIPYHVYYQLAIVGLLWLCIVLYYIWPSRDARSPSADELTRAPQVQAQTRQRTANLLRASRNVPIAPRVHTMRIIPKLPPPQRPEPMPPTNRRPRVH